MNESREGNEMTFYSADKPDVESGEDVEDSTSDVPGQKYVDVVAPEDNKPKDKSEDMEDSTSDVPGQKYVDVVAPEDNKPKDKKTPPYRCHVCRQYFERSFEYSTHLRTHARLLQADIFLLCFICGAKFKDDVEVSTHLETHEHDEVPRCRVCSEPYNHFTRLHTGPKPFKCSMCLKIYQKSTDFHFHLNTHSGDLPNKCHICEKGFSRKDRLRLHIETEHGIKTYKCEQCKKYFEGESTFEKHKKNHHELVYVQCDVCNKVFNDTKSLGKHRSFHNCYDHFTCKFCGSKFNNFDMVKEHVKEHFSEPSHACNICKRKFLSVDELTVHRKIHYKTITGNSLSNKSGTVLSIDRNVSENPQKTYLGPKLPFKCGQCPKSFYNAKALKRHENSIHRDARHTCKLCGIEFSRPENLKAHVKNIHAGEISAHKCTICWIRFKNAIELNNHITKHHPVKSEGPVSVLTSSSNGKITKKPASATRSFSGSNKDGHKVPDAVKNEKLRKHVHPSGSTSVVSISGIYRGNNLNVNTADDTVGGGKEQGELDRSSIQNIARVCVCRFCGKCFSVRHYCRLHRKRHKESEIVEKCSKCLKAFGQHDHFMRHRCTEGKIEPYECDICDEPFTSSFLLLRHRMIHKGPMHKCDKCNRMFTRKCNLDRHKSGSHAWISEFKCMLCHRNFFSKKAHFLHLKTHVRTNKCTVCNLAFRSPDNFNNHIQNHHKVGNMYKCQTCEVKFSSVQSYLVHQLTHMTNAQNICDICGKKFRDKEQFVRHRKTHWGTKLDIACTWCGMKYTAVSSLRRHRQRNMCWRDRSFPCIICGDKFQRLDLLQTHTKMHIDSSKVLPVQSDINESVGNGNSNEDVGDDIFENFFDQDNEAQVSYTGETAMKRQNIQCNDDTMAYSEFLNEEDVLLDDDFLGSDFPGQSPTSSVMFSCGECNSEFSTLQHLQRHIDTHNTKSQNANAELSFTHSPHIEPHESNPESLEYDAESQARETGRQSHPHEQDTDPHNPSVKHNIGIHNDLDQVLVSSVSKDIQRDGDKLPSDLYKCGLCEEMFQDIVDLNDHISNHTDDQNLYKCDICGNVLNSILSFHNHCVSHVASDKAPGSKTENTPTTPQRVNVFEMAFLTSSPESDSDSCTAEGGISTNNTLSMTSKENIILEQNLEDITKPVKEERLGIFDLLKLDNVHINTKDVSRDVWKCNICAKTFDSEFEHQRHKKQHTSEKETQVDEHNACSQTNAHVSPRNNTGQNDTLQNGCAVTIKLYKCGKCDLSFCVPSELTGHSKVHFFTDRSATCSADSESPLNSISPTTTGQEALASETPLLSTTSNSHVISPGTTTHTCGACAGVYLSADALYSHCHTHVTSPTVKICRLSILDSNISGSVLLEDLPSGVYTPMTNTQTAIQVENTTNESHEIFSSDVEKNNQHIAQKTNENNETLVRLLNSKFQYTSTSGLKIPRMNGHSSLISSSISKPSVSKDVRIMTLPNRLCSNDASRESDNSRNTLKSLLKCRICSRLFGSAHGLDGHHRRMHPTDHRKEGLPVQAQYYTCTDCHKLFRTARSLHLHEAKSHSKRKGLYKCTTCGMEFMSASRLRAHNSIHTNWGDKTASEDSPFKCLLCDRVFGTFHGIRIHSNYHTGEERTSHLSTAHRYRCLLCRISFYTVLQLNSHVNKTHSNIVYEPKQQSQTSDSGDITYKSKHEPVLNLNTETTRMEDKNSCISQSDRQGIRSNEGSTGREVDEDNTISSWPSPPGHTSLSSSAQTLSASVTGPRDRPCECLECNRVFQSAFELGESCRQCEDSKLPFPFKCLTCQRMFSTIKGIRIHMLAHPKNAHEKSQKRLFTDDTANRESSSPKVPKLATELNGVHKSSYHCWICVREFSSIQEFRIHMKMHPDNSTRKTMRQPSCTSPNANKNNETPLLNSLQDSVNPAVLMLRTGTMRYKCRLCPRLFPSTSNMLRHLKTHSQKHKCDMCGDVFSDVWTYQTHRSAHKVTSSHMCHLCKKEFPTLSSLVRHRKAHTGKSLPYRCDICNDEYAAIEELTKHCITHKEDVQDGSDVDDDIVPNSNTDDEKGILGKERDENERHDNFNSGSSFTETSVLPNKETEINDIESDKQHVNIVDKSIQSDSESLTYAKPTSVEEKQHFTADVENIETSDNIQEQQNENGSNEQIGVRVYKCDICNQSFQSLQEIGEHCRSHMETENTDIKTRADADLFKSMKVSGTNLYICNICDREYLAVFSLQRHYKLHEGEMMYICHVCDKTFHQPGGLRQHLLTHNQDAMFKCRVCGQKYNNMRTFKTHKNTHSYDTTDNCVLCCKDFAGHKAFLDHKIQCEKERKCVCDICGKGFTRTNLLTEHRKIHEDTRPYRCYDCGNRYTCMENLKRHMETAHNRNISLDTIIKMTHGKNNTKASLNKESNRDTGPEFEDKIQVGPCTSGAQAPTATVSGTIDDYPHKCVQCNKHFPSLESLRRHTVVHLREKNAHTCDGCGKDFSTTEELNCHNKIHHGNKNDMFENHFKLHKKEGIGIACSVCGEYFQEKTLLQQHVETMHAAKYTQTNQCCVCGNMYKHSSDLEKHLWIVHRERQVTCDVCQGRFGNKDALNRHVLQKHDTMSHKCPECLTAFSTPDRLQRHIAVVHPQQPYACSICNIQFQSMSAKQRHMSSTHAQRVNARVKSVQWATKLSSRMNKNIVQSTEVPQVNVPDIKHNQFTEVPQVNVPDIKHNHFTEVPQVNVPDIKHSQSTEVPQGNVPDIKHNQFTEVPQGNVPDIKHNQSTEVPQGNVPDIKHNQFTAVPQVNVPDITHNQFTEVPQVNVPDIKHNQFTEVPQVNVPDIKHNQLTKVPRVNIQDVKPNRLWACKICRKTFPFVPDRQRHMVEMHGSSSYKQTCSTCGQMFATKSRLKKHETLHTGEKPFPCHICHNVFRTRAGLSAHLQYHTGERQYSCIVCNKSFLMKNHLQLHILRAHPGMRDDTSETESD